MVRDYLKTIPQYFIPKKCLTIWAGKLANCKQNWIKNTFIRLFIKKFKVNMQEALQENPKAYADFNDFFIRKLKPELRPIADEAIVSPVDGVISELGRIKQAQIIQAKGHDYSVEALLAADALSAKPFIHGHFATLYLAPKDYHRIHMPLDATLEEMIYVPGSLYSVQPATARVIPGLFAKNERLVVFFQTKIGKMAMVLVGATIVGSIGTDWAGVILRGRERFRKCYREANIAFKKGDEMGYFKLGSTVILLFSADCEALSFCTKTDSPIKFGEALFEVAALKDGSTCVKSADLLMSNK